MYAIRVLKVGWDARLRFLGFAGSVMTMWLAGLQEGSAGGGAGKREFVKHNQDMNMYDTMRSTGTSSYELDWCTTRVILQEKCQPVNTCRTNL